MKRFVQAAMIRSAVSVTAWGQSAVWLPQNAQTGSIYYNNGNVGIGTSAPASWARLDVQGAANQHVALGAAIQLANAAAISTYDGGGANVPMELHYAGELVLFDAGTPRMTIYNGTVGIGGPIPPTLRTSSTSKAPSARRTSTSRATRCPITSLTLTTRTLRYRT